MITKFNCSNSIIILFVLLTSTMAFGQKLSREAVNSKLPRSWTGVETGKPGETLAPVRNVEIMDFRPDGTVTTKQYSEMMGNLVSDVLWGFDEANQKLVLTLPNGSLGGTQEFEIIELTDDQLVLVTEEILTVYIPTENTGQQKNEVDVLNEGLNPNTWSGKLQYNIVVKTDHNYNTSKEKVPGEITLERLGEKKIIRKKELGSTITWTITDGSYSSNITRYSAVCSNLNFNGDISFENGFMIL
jgi:hypothetical protein